MRLWSLHPGYLDPAGLVALWREALLAQKVLAGATRGYRSHPQLVRFAAAAQPLATIGLYLSAVADEADRRGYRFDRSRIHTPGESPPIPVTTDQIAFEWQHLLRKLAARSPDAPALRLSGPELLHPLFVRVPGGVEAWERGA